jgi:hypothetical protein
MKRCALCWVLALFFLQCGTHIFQGLPDDGSLHGKAWWLKKVYYYYPDAEIYWIAENNAFAVIQDGAWVVVPAKPAILTSGYYYVVLETSESQPWLKHEVYKKKYPPGKIKPKSKKK